MGHDGALSKKVADDPASERTLDSCMGARSTAVVIEVAGRFRRRGALRWSDGPIAASEIYEEAPMEDAAVLVEQRAGYRVITLNRPRQLNAVNEAMQQALKRALAEAEEDCDCRALLLTGAGRAFCAGQDLRERMTADGKTTVLGSTLDTYYNPLVRKLRTLPFPVVAAVNGVAAGAGANIALACDIVLAARSASFVQAFAKIGLIPDCGGTWFLPRLVGPARARGLALTAEPLPADKAEAWGLIWKTFDDPDLMAQAHQLCVQFTAAPTVALALIKRALDETWGNDLDAQLDLERESQREASLTPDYAEGVRAFLQKRPPAFTGRRAP
jgi:2-(1,2-epoxy-1,2-dihydrophenyl)acetyl-CoA isomerase